MCVPAPAAGKAAGAQKAAGAEKTVGAVKPTGAENLLGNPGFEQGQLGPWGAEGNASVVSDDVRSGRHAVRLANAQITQGNIPVQKGRPYKAFAWVKIVSEQGHDWGGFSVSVMDQNWKVLDSSGSLLALTHGNEWFKVALKFTAPSSAVIFRVGYFGGPGRKQVAIVDDCALVEDAPGNKPPEVQIQLTPAQLTAAGEQTYRLLGDDPDGAITHVVWEFGDGLRAFGWHGKRHVGVPGRYTARVTVVDDEGAVVRREASWEVRNKEAPNVQIITPADDNLVVDKPRLAVSGTATGLKPVLVSTDRGFLGEATGFDRWRIEVPLSPGWNRISVWNQTRRVRYVPPGPLAITDLKHSADTVEQWEPIEITFTVSNSAATHPQFPYEKDLPPGLEWIDGVRVDGLFTPDDGRTWYRRPAFLYQPYQWTQKDGEDWMYPQGTARWCVRFAPPKPGQWKYRIELAEAKGQTTSELRSFQVTQAKTPGNHGPIRVSPTDGRYFEFADGTPFLGSGYALHYNDAKFFELEQMFRKMGRENETFLRMWISGRIWGSAWQAWSSRTLPYDGIVPATGLGVDAAFGDGLASWKFDEKNPILFQGFMAYRASLIPGKTYRVRIRWRTENVTGPAKPGKPFGLCVKFVGWPEPGQTLDTPTFIPHINGHTPWHVTYGTFTAKENFLPNMAIILENTTGGRGFVDECAVEEVLGDGRYGPNLLRGHQANQHLYFNDRWGAAIDHIFRVAQAENKYIKLVISEKAEYLINHISPHGLPHPHGNYFNAREGAPRRLHQYYWRHLSARLGAFRSVHSWEMVNEEAPGPGDHFALTAAAAQTADADGNPHPVSTSTWASLAVEAWKHPESKPIHYVDFHCYVRHTGWIEPKDELANDSARFFHEYDKAALAAGFGKPVVWGEMGIDGDEKSGADSDGQAKGISRDTQGVWLHKIIWARCGPGGVYPLYWWPDNVFKHSLHNLYGNWHRFMAGIPLNNGRYADAGAKSSNPAIRVIGQKDTTAGRAHLWIDNAGHTWRNVVEGRKPTPQSATITLPMGKPNARFQLTWYDTSKGVATGTETRTANASGALEFAVKNLATDTAVRIQTASPGTRQ